MIFPLLDGESMNRRDRNTGLEETHGEHTGERMDSLEYKCISIT